MATSVFSALLTGITSSLIPILSSTISAGLVPSALPISRTALGVPTLTLSTDTLGNIIALSAYPTYQVTPYHPSLYRSHGFPQSPEYRSPRGPLQQHPSRAPTLVLPTLPSSMPTATLPRDPQVMQAIVNGLETGNGIAIPGYPCRALASAFRAMSLQILKRVLVVLVQHTHP